MRIVRKIGMNPPFIGFVWTRRGDRHGFVWPVRVGLLHLKTGHFVTDIIQLALSSKASQIRILILDAHWTGQMNTNHAS